jgi:hypothetical protein
MDDVLSGTSHHTTKDSTLLCSVLIVIVFQHKEGLVFTNHPRSAKAEATNSIVKTLSRVMLPATHLAIGSLPHTLHLSSLSGQANTTLSSTSSHRCGRILLCVCSSESMHSNLILSTCFQVTITPLVLSTSLSSVTLL